eukprot:2136630-Karenia_brevis.AAC.1
MSPIRKCFCGGGTTLRPLVRAAVIKFGGVETVYVQGVPCTSRNFWSSSGYKYAWIGGRNMNM